MKTFLGTLTIVVMLATNGHAAAQATFSSANEAVQTLFQAAQSGNDDRIVNILGGPATLFSSNDDVRDELDRELFLEKYQEMHRLSPAEDGSMFLYIGAENWRFPVPLVEKDDSWRFDAAKGREEIQFRRTAANESMVIRTCREFADAQKAGGSGHALLHGYYFRLVLGSKPDKSFLLIAYPVEYRSSGIMTFLVTQSGVVYQKDLGPNTPTIASVMDAFHEDPTWRVAEE